MSENKTWSAAAIAAGLVALAALIGCGGEESVASKSAAAFEEAQKRGETFGGEGHAHGGHGASTPGGEPAGAVPQQPSPEGMDHAAHGAPGERSPADHSSRGPMEHGAEAHAGGHAPQRSGSAQAEAGAEHQGHAGHGAPATPAPAGPVSHSGHSASGGETPSRPVQDLPAQPAGILRPDSVDAPAATSVLDARRSAEMSQAMSGGGHGGHGGDSGHGAGIYKQTDAGRGPGAYEGSEPQTPGARPQHHDHGGAAVAESTLYVCPMHPEITSKSPGTCPKCGMNLVERREE